MHDFCICADNAAKGKVLAALLKHPGNAARRRRMFTCVSSEQEPLVWAKPLIGETRSYTLRNRTLQPLFAVCNTLFAGVVISRVWVRAEL